MKASRRWLVYPLLLQGRYGVLQDEIVVDFMSGRTAAGWASGRAYHGQPRYRLGRCDNYGRTFYPGGGHPATDRFAVASGSAAAGDTNRGRWEDPVLYLETAG